MHEALAYCKWLNDMLATAPVLEGSEAARLIREGAWQVSLASELEWEKAARGGLPAAVYSWGDTPDPNRANYRESGVNDRSAVGCFPANGFGLYDMIGNVWEWTRSRCGSYPYRSDDVREPPLVGDSDLMVVRGGSWRFHQDYARCAYRDGPQTTYGGFSVGFRVVMRCAPVS